MGINAIQLGTLSSLRNLQKPVANQFVAQNFQKNFGNGELVPKVQNEVLANKLNIFA